MSASESTPDENITERNNEHKAPDSAIAPKPALREDQINNAVSFLSHPKVLSSPVASKRSFLERKGLTSEEIDEAFKRVKPQQASADAQALPSTPANTAQPTASQLPATVSATPALQPPGPGPAVPQYRWTQLLLGASIIAAGGWAAKELAAPYVKSAIRRLTGKSDEGGADKTPSSPPGPTPEQQALISASEELKKGVEALADVAAALKLSAVAGGRGVVTAELRQELQSMVGVMQAGASGQRGVSEVRQETAELRREVEALRAALQGAAAAALPQQLRPVSSGSQQQQAGSSAYNGHVPPHGSAPPHPPSYMEIVEMLQKGITPGNVRTDISDAPPDPSAPLSAPKLQPRPKPWEQPSWTPPTASPDPYAHTTTHTTAPYTRSTYPPAYIAPAIPSLYTTVPPSTSSPPRPQSPLPYTYPSPHTPPAGSITSTPPPEVPGTVPPSYPERLGGAVNGAGGGGSWKPPPIPSQTVSHVKPAAPTEAPAAAPAAAVGVSVGAPAAAPGAPVGAAAGAVGAAVPNGSSGDAAVKGLEVMTEVPPIVYDGGAAGGPAGCGEGV